jgi:hypothetical protein
VSTVVQGDVAALAKAHEYLDDGFQDIRVGLLDGKDMPLQDFEQLMAAKNGDATNT